MLYLYLALAAVGHYAKPKELQGRSQSAGGTVVTVTRRSVTIRDEFTGSNRRFPANARLAAGLVGPKELGSSYSYKLSDVRVGDRISVDYDDWRGEFMCVAVCIHRRPGGRVPPTWGPDYFWDVHMNAEQDAEDAGLPPPDWKKITPPRTPKRWEYRQP